MNKVSSVVQQEVLTTKLMSLNCVYNTTRIQEQQNLFKDYYFVRSRIRDSAQKLLLHPNYEVAM